jgi:hypothetical protein
MASTQALLKIVSVDNFCQSFGTTDYATFICETQDGDSVTTAVSHNALTSKGVSLQLLNLLSGSTLIVNDDTDLVTKQFKTGQERVAQIVNRTLINPRTGLPSQMIMLNRANSGFLPSDTYKADTLDLASSIQSKYQFEKEKARKIEALKKSQERMQLKQAEAAKVAELEVNEDEAF